MKRLFVLQVIMLISAVLFAGEIEAGPGIATVETDKGTVQGYIRDGIYTFHGIPYAEVTKRFMPAEEVQPWDGVLFANAYGPISPQPVSIGGTGKNSGRR